MNQIHYIKCLVSLLSCVLMFFACVRSNNESTNINQEQSRTSESVNEKASSNLKSSSDWVIGKWQTTTNDFGLTTLIVKNSNTVIFYGSNTDRFQGTYIIENDVMYCFFATENIQFPLDKKNQTIDFGDGYFAKKVGQ